MKKILGILLLTILLAIYLYPSTYFNCTIKTDIRSTMNKDMAILFNENLVNFRMLYRNNNMKIIGDMDIFTLTDEMPSSIEELSSLEYFYSPYIRINEAYAYIFDFPLHATDMKAGIQRINMGSGEMMSTLDILNAYDQTDRWSYENRLGTFCIEMLGYNGVFSWNIGIIPIFTPNILPQEFTLPSFSMPAYVNISSISSTVNSDNSLRENIQCFASLQMRNKLGDVALHYIYWKDNTPWADSVFVSQGVMPWDVSLRTVLHYPRTHVAGLSFTSSIGSVGIWGNAACFMPCDNDVTLDLSAMGMPVYDSTNVDGSYYIKADIGVDYTFTGGFYINMHYLRGMYYEFGNIHDYLFLGTRLPLFYEKLIISPLNCALELASYEEIHENSAFLYIPAIEYNIDNFSIGLKMLYIWSGETCSFYENRNQSGAGMYLKADF